MHSLSVIRNKVIRKQEVSNTLSFSFLSKQMLHLLAVLGDDSGESENEKKAGFADCKQRDIFCGPLRLFCDLFLAWLVL